MTNYEVNYEPSVSFAFDDDTNDADKGALLLFRHHGLEQILSTSPPYLLERAVIEFYQSLNKNADSGAVTASVTLTLAEGSSALLDIDVREVLRSSFNLPNSGELVSSIANADVAAAMATAVSSGKTTGTLKTVNFLPMPKFALKVVKESLIGMLGSRDQVSLPQQRILTALLNTEVVWNWEELFVNVLVDAKRSTKLKLGSKVSTLILKAAEGSSATWPNPMVYNLPPIVARLKKDDETDPSEPQQPTAQPQTQPASTTDTAPTISSPPHISKQPTRWNRIPRPTHTAPPPPSKTLTIKETSTLISSQIQTEAELTSASDKAAGKQPLLPTSQAPLPPPTKPTSPPHTTEPASPSSSSSSSDDSDLRITECVSPHTSLFKLTQDFKDRISEKADNYIQDHFPTLLSHPETLEPVKRLLVLLMYKATSWSQIKELSMTDTWEALAAEETEVLSIFEITSIWTAMQSLEAHIAHFCTLNGVPTELNAAIEPPAETTTDEQPAATAIVTTPVATVPSSTPQLDQAAIETAISTALAPANAEFARLSQSLAEHSTEMAALKETIAGNKKDILMSFEHLDSIQKKRTDALSDQVNSLRDLV